MVQLMVYCKNHNIEIKAIDLGGGFPVESESQRNYSPQDIGQKLVELLKELVQKNSLVMPYLLFEPGKFIVANSAFGVVKVISKKKMPNKEILITDGSTYGFVPDVLAYKVNYDLLPICNLDKRVSRSYTVCGSTCDCIDVIGENKRLPLMKEKDLIMIMNCGAYSNVMSSNFNTSSFVISPVFFVGEKFASFLNFAETISANLWSIPFIFLKEFSRVLVPSISLPRTRIINSTFPFSTIKIIQPIHIKLFSYRSNNFFM